MNDLKHRLQEDLAIRDAARSILSAQLARIRQGFSGERIGAKLADRFGDGLLTAVGKAGDAASKNKGMLATAIGLIAMAVALKPIMNLLDQQPGESAKDGGEKSGDA